MSDIRRQKSLIRRLTTAAVLTAAAMVLSWVEAILPLSVGIPGVKLGLCHIITLLSLRHLTAWETAAVTVVRVVLTAALFGSLPSLLYSAAGALLSLAIMLILRRVRIAGREAFSLLGVSIAGGVSHNLGQLIAAACLMQTSAVWGYLPVLLIAGTLTGALIGTVAAAVARRV